MTHFLHRPDGKVAYDLLGESTNPLVILSAGMADTRATFRFLAPQLAEAGYRVAVLDLRGHGESSVGWRDYSTTAVASDFLALIDELGGAPAAIVGSSYSAGAGVIAAYERPEAIRALVLTGAFVRTLPGNLATRLSQALVTYGPLGRPLWLNWYNKRLWPLRKPADFDKQFAALKANLREPGRMKAAQAMMRIGHGRSAAIIDQVTTPALVIMGSKDPDFPDPLAEVEYIAGALAGPVEKLIIEGGGHYPQAEAVELVAPAVLSFLKRTA